MVRIVFALACLIASFAATAGTNAVTNVTVVVIDRAESQRRMEEARAKFNALTDAERRARMQESSSGGRSASGGTPTIRTG